MCPFEKHVKFRITINDMNWAPKNYTVPYTFNYKKWEEENETLKLNGITCRCKQCNPDTSNRRNNGETISY